VDAANARHAAGKPAGAAAVASDSASGADIGIALRFPRFVREVASPYANAIMAAFVQLLPK
jgi:hypothetical protein